MTDMTPGDRDASNYCSNVMDAYSITIAGGFGFCLRPDAEED
jgi:hypothetical protein